MAKKRDTDGTGPVTPEELQTALFALAPPPTSTPVELLSSVDIKATVVQEIILSAIADLHLRARSGLFGKDEANTLEKLIGFSKEFSTIAKAINDVADYKSTTGASEVDAKVHVSDTVKRLRAAMGKPRA